MAQRGAFDLMGGQNPPMGQQVTQPQPNAGSGGAAKYLAMAQARMSGAPAQSQAGPPQASAVDMLRSRLSGSLTGGGGVPQMANHSGPAIAAMGGAQDPASLSASQTLGPSGAPSGPDPSRIAEIASLARKAGIKPNVPKGTFKPGPQAPTSGHSVHQLANPDLHPDLHAALRAASERRGGKLPKGPETQIIAAAAGYKLSGAQATGLARKISSRVAEEKAKLAANRYAGYIGSGAKVALGGK